MGFRSSTSDVQSVSAVTTSVGTVPAGVQAGDRVYAFVGSGGTNPVTITPPAGWTQVATAFKPTGFMVSSVWYRDVLSSSEAGDTATWTFSVSSRTWNILLAYSGVDLTRAPVANVGSGMADSAGPSTAPTVVLPEQDWLLTFVAGRESPGSDTAKSWSINPSDTERVDAYTTHTGTGAKLVVAAYDSNGTVDVTDGGSGGAVSVGPQAPPTNTYNAIVTSVRPFKVGATVDRDQLTYWGPKLAGNDWMRIFPDPDKTPPDWGDSRFTFIRDYGGDPFISTKCNGDATKIAKTRSRLLAMPVWILDDPERMLWFAEFHEPEGNMTASQFKNNVYEPVWQMVEGLPSNIRAKIMFGPVVTRQKTENNAGRTYKDYDPGPAKSDFFGVDMYMNSWLPGNANVVATSYTNAVTFLSQVKAYTYDGLGASTADTRPRIFPELGAIGLPADTDGTARAAWIQALQDELLTWSEATQGWPFGGWIWWCDDGTVSDTTLEGAGRHRWFALDRRHNGQNYVAGNDPQGNYDIIPSVDPPGGGGGGSVATDRQVSTNIPVGSSHVWSVTVPMVADTPPPDPSTVNAWSHLGLPQR
jgi:hypothetical protein